jgi:AraC-like DNA-binding protein
MSQSFTCLPIEGPLIQRVAVVDRLSRAKPERFQSSSLPGHLLHLVTEGEVRQTTGGRLQHLAPGNAVWYFENEPVRGEILRAPWTFYTVNFEAPTLAPPPEDQRIHRVRLATASKFEALFEAWQNEGRSDTVRHIRVHALLLDLLLDLLPAGPARQRADTPTQIWWDIETQLRGKLDQVIDLAFLQNLSGRSQRSIVDTCKQATGTSPMRRVKELRLSYARGLVLHSALTISEIAYRTGYSRVQELSRDYHQRFGATPREDRTHGPIYRKLERSNDAI